MKIKNTTCEVRKDLQADELCAPTKSGIYLSGNNTYKVIECKDEEVNNYNMIIMDSEGNLHSVYSIDFDFY